MRQSSKPTHRLALPPIADLADQQADARDHNKADPRSLAPDSQGRTHNDPQLRLWLGLQPTARHRPSASSPLSPHEGSTSSGAPGAAATPLHPATGSRPLQRSEQVYLRTDSSRL